LTPDKLDELRAESFEADYDVRFVTERWFTGQTVNNIEGYDCFRRDRIGKRGGGVCIYTNRASSYNFGETNNDHLNSSNIEQVWCVADSGMESILLECIYTPKILRDNKGAVKSLEEQRKRDKEINKSIYMANSLVRKGTYKGLLIAGDFNYTELDWKENLDQIYNGSEKFRD